MRYAVLVGVLLIALSASLTHAAGGPESAVVVVNADSWASTYLANQYIHARGIPAANVVFLRDLPSFERMPVEAFREQILRPVQKTIEARKLVNQIDYVLYSADFPTTVDVKADIGERTLPKVITPQASINSMTYLHQLVLAKNPSYLDFNVNCYARRRVTTSHDTRWTDAQRERYQKALARLQQFEPKASKKGAEQKPAPEPPKDPQAMAKEHGAILDELAALQKEHPDAADLHYNRACTLVRLAKLDEAMAALGDATQAGWLDYAHLLRDNDLRPLRTRDDFQKLVKLVQEKPLVMQPPLRFAATSGWLPTGQRVPPNQGLRYLLSTMLAYTSGRGNSVSEAWAGLRRSIAADGTRPKGTVYYLRNNDVRSTTREWGFAPAAAKLRELGVNAAVESGTIPVKKSDVAGLTAGAASFNWPSCGSTIMPGAICEHLTSCGGMLQENAGQTPLTEFLRYGAAGAPGTVTEPYALQAKFPTPFIHVFYAQGCTLAEAFYQSVTGPYQLLIVGDALCAPWARRLEVTADGLKPGAVLRGPLRVTPRAAAPDGLTTALFELLVDGRRVHASTAGGDLQFDTTTLPDGPHETGVVAYANDLVATRGALTANVVVRNGDQEIQVIKAPAGEISWDKTIEFELGMPGAKEIVILQHGREAARVAGARGRLTIDPRQLGAGPSRLQPVARREPEARDVWGKPIDVTVAPPPGLPAQKAPDPKRLASGMQLTIDGGTPQVIGKLEPDTLAKSGVKKGQSFAIEAWFEALDDDVHQFQLSGDAKTVAVDGRKLDWPRGKTFWFLPVALRRGWHRARIEGQAGPSPKLDARFGGNGARRLDGARFQHVGPAAQ